MKKLCSKGYKISNADQKAFDHYLIVTPREWADSALKGMINKAIKTIIRQGFEAYKETIDGNVSADLAVIIPGILALKDFKLNKIQVPEQMVVKRKQPKDKEIWENGFDIEDYEEMALKALYEDPEAMLDWFMENKIYQRRKAFCKEHEEKLIREKVSFPAKQDDFIDFVTKDSKYKNRKEREQDGIK